MIDVILETIFERALASEFGVGIATETTEALRRKLYAMRKALKERGLPVDKLKVQISPDGTEVWLVKYAERPEDQQADDDSEAPPLHGGLDFTSISVPEDDS